MAASNFTPIYTRLTDVTQGGKDEEADRTGKQLPGAIAAP